MGTSISRAVGIPFNKVTLVNPFPVPSLQSFASDLTVIESGENHYFKDIYGNHILITNYDFPTGWKNGWPIKSAATVDIFGQTGILATDLFNLNFDFSNKYFTKYTAQILDPITLVETAEPRISAIVSYSEALTGDNLTTANTFFGATTEDANYKWIDPTTAEAAGTRTGSKTHPWKLLTEAYNAITGGPGVGIYVKSGTITETAAFIPAKQIVYKAIGKVVYKSNQINVLVGNSTNVQSFDGFTFDGQNLYEWVGFSVNYKNVSFKHCSFLNPKTNASLGNVNAYSAASPLANTFDQCIFTGTLTRGFIGAIHSITNSHFKSTATSQLIRTTPVYSIAKYCRFNMTSGTVFQPLDCGIDAQFNEITQAGKSVVFIDDVSSGHTNATKFNNQKIRQADINGTAFINIRGTNSECKNNDIVLTGTSTNSTDNTTYLIRSIGSGANIDGNQITAESERISQYIFADSSGAAKTGLKINNNVIHNKKASGGIAVDGEKTSAAHHYFDGFELNKNSFFGPVYHGNAYGTGHGMLIWGNNGSVRGNYVEGEKLGQVFKSQGATCAISTASIDGLKNRMKNCNISLMVKGINGITFEDYVIDSNDNGESGALIAIIVNSTYKSQNITVKNGIFNYRGTNASCPIFTLDDAANLTGLSLVGNTYYTSQPNCFAVVAGTTYTFAQWVALTGDNGTLLSVAPAVAI